LAAPTSKEHNMLFMSHCQILPGNRDAAIQRFAQTGGRPPKGVELIRRCHDLASGTRASLSTISASGRMT